MGKVITFINEKGGTGKTTSCFNIGKVLSEKKKVLLIDIDGQAGNLTFHAGIKKNDNMLTIHDVLYKNKPLDSAIINIEGKLDIVPATTVVAEISQTAKIKTMKSVIDSVRDKYDYILIDVNPAPQWSHVLSLCASDYVIIPILPDVTSIEGTNAIIETINEVVESVNPDLKILGILINKNVNNTNLSKEVKDTINEIAEQVGTSLFDSTIRMTVTMAESVAFHKAVTDYDPKSDVAKDVRKLVKEIERRIK